jgi:serine/threonine-protein kinase
MLMDNGRVKVSDFGVARLDNSELTSTGMMVGTPNYMSPEGMHGFQVDNRSDLYSVGVLFYELLTGQRPYSGIGLEEAIAPLDSCETIDPMSRAQVRPVILKALQGKPELRFQDAASFLEALISIMSESGSEQGTVIYQPTKVVRIAKNIRPEPDQTGNIETLHPDLLSSIESSLIRYVGPSAKVLIKKYSKEVSTLEELSMTLAKKIPNESERAEFLRALETSGVREAALSLEAKSSSGLTRSGFVPEGARAVYAEPLQLSPEKLQSVTSELAFFIGPLAGRLVKKVFKQSSNLEEFYSRLSSLIPDASEQADFLNRVK